MKKRYFILIVITILIAVSFSAVLVTTGRHPEMSTKSPAKAIYTISEKFGGYKITDQSSVTVDKVNLLAPDEKGNNDYLLLKLTNISDPDAKVLFLIDDDNQVLMAEEATRSFYVKDVKPTTISTEYLNEEYHTDGNFFDGTFAYHYKDETTEELNCIISLGHMWSSIWVIQGNEISLLDYNPQCECWQ